jgi:Tfp pilus assembly protein PilV
MRIFNKGQSLVEILIALSVASISAVAIVRAVTVSTKNSRTSQEQKTALSLAQTEISNETENRNLTRNTYFTTVPSPTAVFSSDSHYCVYKNFTDISSELVSGTMFKLEVDVFWNWKISGEAECSLSVADLDSYENKVHLETKLIK